MRGVLYLTMGAIAAQAAAGAAGRAAGTQGALQALAHQPFGRALLFVATAGLGGFALWCLWRTLRPKPRAETWWGSLLVRADFLIGFVIHAMLVLACVYLLTGYEEPDPTGDRAARHWTAWLLSYPAGRLALAVAGLYLVGAGLGQIYIGATTNLRDVLDLDRLAPAWRVAAVAVSRTGIAARGIVLALVGVFLLLAAYRHDPHRAHGIGGALEELELRPYGPWLLGSAAAGLLAYGAYELLVRTLCRHRHTI